MNERAKADETFMLLVSDKKNSCSFTLPIVDFALEKNSKEVNLIFQQNFDMIKDNITKINKEELTLTVDYTDDPTPQTAGSVVSLGYPLIRIVFENCKIENYNPLVLSGPLKGFSVKFNREQRESLIEMEDVPLIKEKVKIDDNSVIGSYYRIPFGWEKPLYIMSCVKTGKDNQTVVERMDMTTFHHKGDVIYLQNHRKRATALKNYDKLVQERISCTQ